MPNKEFYKQQLKNEIEQRAYNKLTQEEKDTIQKAEKIIGENQPLWRLKAEQKKGESLSVIAGNTRTNEKIAFNLDLITPKEKEEYEARLKENKESKEEADLWQHYIEYKEKVLYPLDNEVCSYAVDEYTKAKQEYEKLGFFGRLWGRIMPSSISKNAEIYEKMKGFEEVLSEKSIDPEYVETFQKIQTNADDRTPMPELEEELNKGEKTLVTGEKELGMIMETEKVTEASPEMGGGVKG